MRTLRTHVRGDDGHHHHKIKADVEEEKWRPWLPLPVKGINTRPAKGYGYNGNGAATHDAKATTFPAFNLVMRGELHDPDCESGADEGEEEM